MLASVIGLLQLAVSFRLRACLFGVHPEAWQVVLGSREWHAAYWGEGGLPGGMAASGVCGGLPASLPLGGWMSGWMN